MPAHLPRCGQPIGASAAAQGEPRPALPHLSCGPLKRKGAGYLYRGFNTIYKGTIYQGPPVDNKIAMRTAPASSSPWGGVGTCTWIPCSPHLGPNTHTLLAHILHDRIHELYHHRLYQPWNTVCAVTDLSPSYLHRRESKHADYTVQVACCPLSHHRKLHNSRNLCRRGHPPPRPVRTQGGAYRNQIRCLASALQS